MAFIKMPKFNCAVTKAATFTFFIFLANSAYSQAASASPINVVESESLYKSRNANDSEFDNPNDGFVTSWRDAEPEYEDTEFGELMYNEPSISTKLEMLRLLSKDTPSILVFMHGLSMGLGVDEILQAAVSYSPEKARDLASAGIKLLPFLQRTKKYDYASYDLERLKEYVTELSDQRRMAYDIVKDQSHSVHAVIARFFDERLALRPQADWFDGQISFMASAQELSSLHYQSVNNDLRWYRSKSTKDVSERPIFISMYEFDKSVLIDGEQRIRTALANDPQTQLPVVFVYNRMNERPIDKLGYPNTLSGALDAYKKENLMLTTTPEWQSGEYHVYAQMSEIHQYFDIPEEKDFEPEAWEKLIIEAENYDVNETSFLVTILGSTPIGDASEIQQQSLTGKYHFFSDSVVAEWDNPRTESQFKYTHAANANGLSLDSLLGKGVIINRPDLLAALNALGVNEVPISIYYFDSARVKSFTRGPRSLIQSALGIEPSVVVPPSGGVAPLLPASPPGIQ